MKFKDYLSTIVVLVLLVITFTGCPQQNPTNWNPSIKPVDASLQNQNPLKPVDASLLSDSDTWDNIKHNGHNYLICTIKAKSLSRPFVTVIHDPDCPCHKGK